MRLHILLRAIESLLFAGEQHKANRALWFQVPTASARAASSIGPSDPVPLSVAPVPRSQLSRCAANDHYSSSGFFEPRISATVLYTSIGLSPMVLAISISTFTGRCRSSIRKISRYPSPVTNAVGIGPMS